MNVIDRMLVTMSLQKINKLAKCTMNDMKEKIGGLSNTEFNILQYFSLENYIKEYLGKKKYEKLDIGDHEYVVEYLAMVKTDLYSKFYKAARDLADLGELSCGDLKKIILQNNQVDFAHAIFDENVVLEENIKDFVDSIPQNDDLL